VTQDWEHESQKNWVCGEGTEVLIAFASDMISLKEYRLSLLKSLNRMV